MSGLGKINAYGCPECRDVVFTVNIAEGVTPFMIRCGECGDMSHSSFYQLKYPVPKDINPNTLLNVELTVPQAWYRPRRDLFQQHEEDAQLHILKGGLLLESLELASRYQADAPVLLESPVDGAKWEELAVEYYQPAQEIANKWRAEQDRTRNLDRYDSEEST